MHIISYRNILQNEENNKMSRDFHPIDTPCKYLDPTANATAQVEW